jgi:very-short-patch-repair endonuclease
MTPAESHLELMLKRLIERSELPKPISQHIIESGGRVVARLDFAFPREKVALEAHGYAHHHGRRQWERDQERLSELTAMGWVVLYVTYVQMKYHPIGLSKGLGRLSASERADNAHFRAQTARCW